MGINQQNNVKQNLLGVSRVLLQQLQIVTDTHTRRQIVHKFTITKEMQPFAWEMCSIGVLPSPDNRFGH